MGLEITAADVSSSARERHRQPRLGGRYEDSESVMRFAPDGTVSWDGQTGEWRMHGDVLRVALADRHCEGAIDGCGVYLLCAAISGGGSGRYARS